jgi:hypothetical protein
MMIPERINASWMATLKDEQLVRAEATLHKEFVKEEKAEKERRGARYVMLRGPESLVTAWLRWLRVNNETSTRGLRVQRGAKRPD